MNYIKRVPIGLWFLMTVLCVITFASLKPSYHFMGWDNYSSFFNITSNISRTFFSTWRAYRGLGAPSDSEVVDMPRQLFFVVTSPLGQMVADQLYYFLMLWIGTIATYYVAQTILARHHHNQQIADIGATTAAFFYLFNLNTLSVFFFPILPYIPRFAAIPLTTYFFISFLEDRVVRWGKILGLFTLMWFTSTAYITATVFITMCISMGLLVLSYTSWRRGVLAFCLLFLINSYWLVPFANYTIQKSKLIRLAPTFINANEIQLNKPVDFYDVNKQVLLSPNFFDSKYSSISGATETKTFHPLGSYFDRYAYQSLYFLFPILFVFGCLVIVKQYKKYRNLYWIPCTIGLFLILSMKEFSPLGFMYAFLSEKIPLFAVLFRFGDTKFHPHVAFAGALACGIGLSAVYPHISILRHEMRKFTIGSVLLLLLCYMFVFRWYFVGDFVGFFMYTRLPDAYIRMAQFINDDTRDGRVLHLPFDPNIYWRSYTWGYLGSAFFNFMIDKPYIDKTFEPASMENAYLHRSLVATINSSDRDDVDYTQTRARAFYKELRETGVSRVLVDESITAEILTRGAVFWGKYPYFGTKKLLDQLVTDGLAYESRTEEIDMSLYMRTYPHLFDLSDESRRRLSTSKPRLILYDLKDPTPKFTFVSDTQYVDPTYTNIYESGQLSASSKTLIQTYSLSQASDDTSYVHYPLQRNDQQITSLPDTFAVPLQKNPSHVERTLRIHDPIATDSAHLISIEAYTDNEHGETVFTVYQQVYPAVQSEPRRTLLQTFVLDTTLIQSAALTKLPTYISNWHIMPNTNFSSLRFIVGSTVVPIPIDIPSQTTKIADVIVEGDVIDLSILKVKETSNLPPQRLSKTQNPNCTSDALTSYIHELRTSATDVRLVTKDGSTCIWGNLVSTPGILGYAELAIDIEGRSIDDEIYTSLPRTSKPSLQKEVASLPKPVILRVCIQDGQIGDCKNSHTYLQINGRNSYILPFDLNIAGAHDPILLLTAKTIGSQTTVINIHDIRLITYESVGTISIPTISQPTPYDFRVRSGDSVIVPKTLSPYSWYFQPGVDAFQISSGTCENDKGYRTYRLHGQDILSWTQGCQNVVTVPVHFKSSNFYLWNTQYHLLSGQYPTIKVADKSGEYFADFASLHLGYPDIPYFKKLQNPEYFFSSGIPLKSLGQIRYQHLSQWLAPHPSYRDAKPKDFTLQQYSENEGVMLVRSMEVAHLPSSWAALTYDPVTSSEVYTPAQVISTATIIPSLYRLEITGSNRTQRHLLRMNEAYDKQWGVYESVPKLLLGTRANRGDMRCDGYANCFDIDGFVGSKTVYIFYWPEKLAWIGWIVTISTFTYLALRLKNHRPNT